MAAAFDINAFHCDAQLVARIVPAQNVFSFLTRQINVPTTCAALVWTDAAQPRLIAATKPIDADGVRDILFVRTLPFQLDYRITGIRSANAYDFTANIRIFVQPVADRAELESFRRAVIGSGNQVQVTQLIKYCEESVRAAASAFAKSHDAESLLSPETWGTFDAVLTEHFKPLGFASGLALESNARVTFESSAYGEFRKTTEIDAARKQRLEREEQLREATNKAREQHLAGLATMLDRVKSMAGDKGVLNVTELIKTFDPAQRGELYRGLVALHEPTRQTQTILVVCGQELLWLNPSDLKKPSRRQELPSDAGGLRSVRVMEYAGQTYILVGARHGVHLLNSNTDSVTTYTFEAAATIRGGINSAILLDDHIYATHSEVGMIEWKLDAPKTPTMRFTELMHSANSVRDIQSDDAGRLWFTINNEVIGWMPGQESSPIRLGTRGEVRALLIAEGYVFAGLLDGSVLQWWIKEPSTSQIVRSATGDAVHSLAWLSGGGIGRLLIGDGRPHLDLQVLGDSYRAEYRCGHNLRWGFASEDCIVGVNQGRDRLFLWRLDQPETAEADISITRLTGESIQDVATLEIPVSTKA